VRGLRHFNQRIATQNNKAFNAIAEGFLAECPIKAIP
jgi:hypothetical protein